MRAPQHGTQMGQFPAIFRRITLHLPSQSTKLISWRKQGPAWLGYILMPTFKCPVVLTACETNKENAARVGDANRTVYIKASGICCQVEKNEHARLRSGQPGISQKEVKDFGETNKTEQTQTNKFQSSLEGNQTMILRWRWLMS